MLYGGGMVDLRFVGNIICREGTRSHLWLVRSSGERKDVD